MTLLPNTNPIHAMCGALPAASICDNVRPSGKTSSQTLHHEAGESDDVTNSPVCGYDANGSPVIEDTTSLFRTSEEYYVRQDEFRAYIAEHVNPSRLNNGLTEIRDAEARECFRLLDKFFAEWRKVSS